MNFFSHSRRQKTGVRPHQIIFEKENVENTYISWEDKMKPRISLEDGITPEEYQTMVSRWDEILSLAEEIIWRNYLNPKSDDLMSEVDSFPDIRFLRDKKHQPYHVKDGRLRHKYHNGKEWVAEWLPLDSPEITKYYRIFLHLRLTGDEGGRENDYMGLDLIAEFKELSDPLEFEILSHNVI